MESHLWFSVGKFKIPNKVVKQSVLIMSLVVYFGFCSSSIAQINVTLDQFKAIFTPGLTFHYTNSDSTLKSVNIGNNEGPNVYDFSNVQLPAYSASNSYFVSSVPNMVSRYPSNAVTIGSSPDSVERNPVFLFGQDTAFVLGEATVITPQEYKHYVPYQIMGKFPLTYGQTFTQSINVYDTLFNSSGGIDSSHTFVVNNITTVDGYGILKIDSYQFEVLRMKMDHTNAGYKEFMYLTREGIFVDIIVPSSQADTGTVQVNGMLVLFASTLTDVKDNQTAVPAEYGLSQNYPNPFNPTTEINYSVPETSTVTIKVYDALGIEIETLVNKEVPGGNYKVEFKANKLSSGIYFYRMQAGSFAETKKLILMK